MVQSSVDKWWVIVGKSLKVGQNFEPKLKNVHHVQCARTFFYKTDHGNFENEC